MRVLAMLLFGAMAWGQFRSTTPLVVAPATVKDARGRFVDGLTAGDLILYDNNVPQRIQMDWMLFPIDLVVAVEAGANAGAVIDKLGGSGILFADLVAAEAGETAVLAFAAEPRAHQAFTSDPDRIAHALRMLRKEPGEACTLDALRAAMRLFDGRPPGRRRIVLMVAEKRDRGSQARLDEVMEQAQRLNVAVYWLTYSPFLEPFTVKPKRAEDLKPEAERIKVRKCALCEEPDETAVPPDLGPGGLIYGLGELFRLGKPDLADLFSRTTGGRAASFLKKSGLEGTIRLIGEEVHRQYILTFEPKAAVAGQYHAVRVIVKGRPELAVKTREGYWALE